MRNLCALLLLLPAVTVAAAEPAITHSFLVTGGETYIVEFPMPSPSSDASPRSPIIFADFESDTYGKWTVEGTAFGAGPVRIADLPAYQGDVRGVGQRVVNSHHTRNGQSVAEGDQETGKLLSPPFTVDRSFILFRIGGGNHPGKTCINLRVDGKIVRTSTGHNANAMRDEQWDVHDLAGATARIEIVDGEAGGWGNIGADQIVLSDEPDPALAARGKIIWRYPASTRDGYVLPDGRILLVLTAGHPKYKGGAVIEVSRTTGEEKVRHIGTQSEVNSAHPLADGGLVVTEAGPKPRLLEYDAAGKVVVEFPLQCQVENHHMQTRMARKLADGTYLVPHLLDFAIRQYDRNGKVLRSIDTTIPGDEKRDIHSWPFTAIRLPNGHTLAGLTHSHRVAEFDADGRKVWELTNDDLPAEVQIRDACGVQRLPNGNTVITSYAAEPTGVRLFEVTPDKKVVWSWRNPAVHGVHHFQILDINGVPLPGEPMK